MNQAKENSSQSPTEYWSGHMVHANTFESREEAIAYFDWRSSIYIDYLKHMPVDNVSGKTVLDYGCGPGNDLIGFSAYSTPERLIAMDVSQPALDAAKQNLRFFDTPIEYIAIDENNNKLALEDNSIDYIHSSGVLHHCTDLSTIMAEFHRVLKPEGQASIMVYNFDSLYLHLHTAWMQPVLNKQFVGLDLKEAFRLNTDGNRCPISKCYKPIEFKTLVEEYGFDCQFKGAAISMTEMRILSYRFQAIQDISLAKEHREFLLNLTFDNRMVPHFNGHVAGIDACYSLTKR